MSRDVTRQYLTREELAQISPNRVEKPVCGTLIGISSYNRAVKRPLIFKISADVKTIYDRVKCGTKFAVLYSIVDMRWSTLVFSNVAKDEARKYIQRLVLRNIKRRLFMPRFFSVLKHHI